MWISSLIFPAEQAMVEGTIGTGTLGGTQGACGPGALLWDTCSRVHISTCWKRRVSLHHHHASTAAQGQDVCPWPWWNFVQRKSHSRSVVSMPLLWRVLFSAMKGAIVPLLRNKTVAGRRAVIANSSQFIISLKEREEVLRQAQLRYYRG